MMLRMVKRIRQLEESLTQAKNTLGTTLRFSITNSDDSKLVKETLENIKKVLYELD